MTTRTITIIVRGPNRFDVFEGERCSDGLTWDEMLGQVAHLTHPKIGEPRYSMLTPEEQAARYEGWKRRGAAADIAEPTQSAIPAAAASVHA